MTDDPGDPAGAAEPAPTIPLGAGLCAGCVHARLVVSGRGSRFVLCGRSRTDPRYPRYPPLPVRACSGFDPRSTPDPSPARP